jgi:putative transposase
MLIAAHLGGGVAKVLYERRRLAVKGKIVGRRRLEEFAGLVTPETILRWYRELIARKYDGSARRGAGRPPPARTCSSLWSGWRRRIRPGGTTRVWSAR